jgi:hypothetical protein
MGIKIQDITSKSAKIASTDLFEIAQVSGATYVSRKVTGSEINELSLDTTPQLGGPLDVNGNKITSASNANIVIEPNGTGAILIGGNSTQPAELRFMEDSDNGTNYVALKASTTLAANTTYTLPTADGTTGQVLQTNGSGILSFATAAGGLTYFTEAQNTTAPNTTTPVDSLTAVSAATNADFAIIPKGNGAIIADIPDNLVSGGNKRGTGAVDLQLSRLTNTEVASGNNSVISGGYRNKATNTDASIGGGLANTASGTQSTVGGGSSNTASSDFSTVGGGTSNSASASRTTVGGGQGNTATAYAASSLGGFGNVSTNNYTSNIGGQSNTASGEHSAVVGGANNVASGRLSLAGGSGCIANATSSQALGSGANVNSIIGRNAYGKLHTAVGDAQTSTFIFAQRTTDATLTNFTIDGTGVSTVNQLILNNNSSYRFKGTIIAKQTATVNVAAWDIDGLLVRGANAAATTLLVSNVTLVQNTPAWGTPTLAADTTNGGLRIQIQGAIATNIQWVANIKTTEVIY